VSKTDSPVNKPQRDPYLDNLKFGLIVLVVLGHLIETFVGISSWARVLYITLYCFHMPAFVFLAGITTKPNARSLIRPFILLVVFQALYEGVFSLHSGHYIGNPLQPYWLLWFLLSLIFWRVISLTFSEVRSEFALLVALVAALLSGCIPNIGYTLSLSRTLVFLPFFIAGFFYGRTVLEKIARLNPLHCLLALPLFCIPSLIDLRWPFNIGWLYGSSNYAALGVEMPNAILIRLAQILSASVLTLLFFAVIPKNECWMSRRGSRVMSVYLLHGFIVLAVGKFIKGAHPHNIEIIFASAVGSMIIVWLLSLPLIDYMMQTILNPTVRVASKVISLCSTASKHRR
jgi:fucose 4-O-acetylase-like acetyltransferase